jgi:hypothetical protein
MRRPEGPPRLHLTPHDTERILQSSQLILGFGYVQETGMSAHKRKTLKILRKMLKIIPDAEHWTQNKSARIGNRRRGSACQPESRRATCFCLYGAKERSARKDKVNGKEVCRELCYTILRRQHRPISEYETTTLGGTTILAAFNDYRGRTYKQIRSVIEETIERIERSGLEIHKKKPRSIRRGFLFPYRYLPSRLAFSAS